MEGGRGRGVRSSSKHLQTLEEEAEVDGESPCLRLALEGLEQRAVDGALRFVREGGREGGK